MVEEVQGIIQGRVQGVGFRYWTANLCNSHGIDGWVKNRMDGSVEFLCQADSGKIEIVLSALLQGPPHSSVSGTEILYRGKVRTTLPGNGFRIVY